MLALDSTISYWKPQAISFAAKLIAFQLGNEWSAMCRGTKELYNTLRFEGKLRASLFEGEEVDTSLLLLTIIFISLSRQPCQSYFILSSN